MKVMLGSYIELIIDPQIDLGELIQVCIGSRCTKPAALTSQQPLTFQQWEIKCMSCGSLLSTKKNGS